MAGVLIFGNVIGGQLVPESLEMATAGAALAESLGEPLCGVLVGDQLDASSGKVSRPANYERNLPDIALTTAAEQFRGGFATLYLIEGKQFRPYAAQAYVDAVQAAIEACAPSVVLFPHNLETRDWVPQLAARLDTGLVMDCIALAAEGNELVVTKPVYGGGVLGQFVVRGAPRMATIRSGIFDPLTVGCAYAPVKSVRSASRSTPYVTGSEIVRLDVPAPPPGRVTLLEEVAAEEAGGLRLKDAKIVVSGGRGLGAPENWHFIEETAAALDGAVGCSRPIADAGWVTSSHQVGLSGTSVAPDLYLAVGISGAVQHLAGISNASTVVAINVDAEADIFTRANYGVVADYRDVLPAFVERVKQLRS